MNQPKIHNDSDTLLSSFRNEFNHPFSSTGYYFKSKIIEGSRVVKEYHAF